MTPGGKSLSDAVGSSPDTTALVPSGRVSSWSRWSRRWPARSMRKSLSVRSAMETPLDKSSRSITASCIFCNWARRYRSEEHTSELQSLMRISYAVFCLKKKNNPHDTHQHNQHHKTTHDT